MPISNELLYILSAFIILILLIAYLISSMKKVIEGQYSYIIVSDHGFKRVLQKSSILWNPLEGVLKGKQAPDIQYTTIDSAGKKVTRHLLDRPTGKLNLRVQCYTLEFIAETVDRHELKVKADVTFQLEPESVRHTIRLEDFGHMLRTRVEAAFCEEISKRHDEKVLEEMDVIRRTVLNKLQVREEGRQNLGICVTDAKFEFSELEVSRHHFNKTTSSQDADNDIEYPQEYYGPADTTKSQKKFSFDKSMLNSLDRLRDLLRETEAETEQSILSIMEMHTRQNIAESLVNSGSLMILSTEDIGLKSGALLREPLRKHFQEQPASENNSSAKNLEQADNGLDKDPITPIET